MRNTEDLIKEREVTYGDYSVNCKYAQDMLDVLQHNPKAWQKLSVKARNSLMMIVAKMGRIMTGGEDHPDNWEDIAGYAKLVLVKKQTKEITRENIAEEYCRIMERPARSLHIPPLSFSVEPELVKACGALDDNVEVNSPYFFTRKHAD